MPYLNYYPEYKINSISDRRRLKGVCVIAINGNKPVNIIHKKIKQSRRLTSTGYLVLYKKEWYLVGDTTVMPPNTTHYSLHAVIDGHELPQRVSLLLRHLLPIAKQHIGRQLFVRQSGPNAGIPYTTAFSNATLWDGSHL